MTDLRALLCEPWCLKHGLASSCRGVTHTGETLDHRPPLATRLPECVPPGLEWKQEDDRIGYWVVYDPHNEEGFSIVSPDLAELLFIGQAVKLGYIVELLKPGKGWRCTWVFDAEKRTVEITDGANVVEATAACMHRVCDVKETKE